MNQITRMTLKPDTESSGITPVHRAMDLTAGGSLARIILDDKVYQLRITKFGKLILTK